MATGTAASRQALAGLRRDAIGLREVLFQSITDMAPGAAIAASIPAGAAYAGGSLPLAVVFALIACLLSASSIGLLAREMPAAGSLSTYAARPHAERIQGPDRRDRRVGVHGARVRRVRGRGAARGGKP